MENSNGVACSCLDKNRVLFLFRYVAKLTHCSKLSPTDHSNVEVQTMLGVPSVGSGDTSGIPAAVDLAKKADVVVLGVGSDLSLEREGHDRTTVGFSDAQKALISRVSAAAKKTIVVTFGNTNSLITVITYLFILEKA